MGEVTAFKSISILILNGSVHLFWDKVLMADLTSFCVKRCWWKVKSDMWLDVFYVICCILDEIIFLLVILNSLRYLSFILSASMIPFLFFRVFVWRSIFIKCVFFFQFPKFINIEFILDCQTSEGFFLKSLPQFPHQINYQYSLWVLLFGIVLFYLVLDFSSLLLMTMKFSILLDTGIFSVVLLIGYFLKHLCSKLGCILLLCYVHISKWI